MNIKMSECCACGAKWQTGQDGSHSCSSKLSKDNQALVEQNKALIEALEHIKRHQEIMAGEDKMILSTLSVYNIAVKALEAFEEWNRTRTMSNG